MTDSGTIGAVTGLNTTTGRETIAGPEVDDPLEDPRLTAFGLLHETHTGALSTVIPDLEACGLSISTFEVLLRLARSPERRLRMAELTAQCTITSSGLTRVVDRMEAAGLVVREPCESDRRGYFAVLTPAGMAELMKALPTHLLTLDRLWQVLDDHEMEALLSALRKLRSAVRPDSDPGIATAS